MSNFIRITGTPSGPVNLRKPNMVGGVRKRPAAAQVPTEDQDVKPFATKTNCSTHSIDYYVPTGEPARCPLCVSERACDELRAELLIITNKLEAVEGQVRKLQPQVDLQSAIRSALEVLNEEDYQWLKLQMYQYKIDKSVILKPTHGKPVNGPRVARGQRLPPNGFMALPRQGDPEGHLATSIGGLAMAEYLDEAVATFGSAQAMGIMLKAWWKALPGADQ